MGTDDLRRVVILSDTHFGEDGAILARADMVDVLMGELRGLGHVDVVVLLGDIWDLWRTSFAAAAAEGSAFIRALASWGGPEEYLLLAGNHDYHLWSFSEEGRRRRETGWEEISDLTFLIAEEGDEGGGLCLVDGLPLRLCYPFISMRVMGRTVLLTHGHHMDFFSRSFWWAKTSWLARWILGRSRGIAISDIDRMNEPFFELLTSTALVPELRSWEYRFYGLLRFFARLLRFESKSGGSPRRYTSVGENTGEARELLSGLLPGYIPDVLVFGHTHRPGFGRAHVGEREVLLANSGCWLESGGEGNAGTYLVIDDAVRLRKLADWEIPVVP